MSAVAVLVPAKTCPCGAVFGRRRHASGRVENLSSYAVRTHCDSCKPPRSPRVTTPAVKSKACKRCGKTFTRRRYANGILVPRGEWDKQRYCTDVCYNAARSEAAQVARAAKVEVREARKAHSRALRAAQRPTKAKAVKSTHNAPKKPERQAPARALKLPSMPLETKSATNTPAKPSQGHTAPTGLGPLQPFAFKSPAPKRHDLMAERESGVTRPEPSDDELLALLKACLTLHEPLLECWEEAAQVALPVRRVPRAGTGQARWQA